MGNKFKIPESLQELISSIIFIFLIWQASNMYFDYRAELNAPIIAQKTQMLRQAVSDIGLFDSEETLDQRLEYWSKGTEVDLGDSFSTTKKRNEVFTYYNKQLPDLGWVFLRHKENFIYENILYSSKKKSSDDYEFRKGNFILILTFFEENKDKKEWAYYLSLRFVKDPQIE